MTKSKKRSYGRDSKDLNNNYTFVTPDKLKKFNGTVEDFLENITHLKPGYLMKVNGKSIIHLWWETKESWFMNYGTQIGYGKTKHRFNGNNGWYIAKDMPSVLKLWLKDDKLEMYLRK